MANPAAPLSDHRHSFPATRSAGDGGFARVRADRVGVSAARSGARPSRRPEPARAQCPLS